MSADKYTVVDANQICKQIHALVEERGTAIQKIDGLREMLADAKAREAALIDLLREARETIWHISGDDCPYARQVARIDAVLPKIKASA